MRSPFDMTVSPAMKVEIWLRLAIWLRWMRMNCPDSRSMTFASSSFAVIVPSAIDGGPPHLEREHHVDRV